MAVRCRLGPMGQQRAHQVLRNFVADAVGEADVHSYPTWQSARAKNVTVQIYQPQDLALALVQLLKRIGYSDCRSLAENDEQAYQMIHATEQVRRALAEAGIAPR